MAIILRANKVNLFVSSVLFVFCYHSPNVLDTPRMPTHFTFLLRSHVKYNAAVYSVLCSLTVMSWIRLITAESLMEFHEHHKATTLKLLSSENTP
jgi:hypothetical protein